MIKKLVEGRWYVWTGPTDKKDLNSWAPGGEMDGILDGKPHQCIKVKSQNCAMFDCHMSGWNWEKHLEKLTLSSDPNKPKQKLKVKIMKKNKEFEKEYEKCYAFLLKKGFKINPSKLRAILASKLKGFPILLVGPTGSGKTHLLSLLAEYWEGIYDYQSLNGSVTIHDLTQERVLGKKGTFEEQDMCLAKWLRNAQKCVSVMHFDEVNAAKAETLLALHPIMDIKGELVLPFSDEVLKVNDNAVLVMSCNEGDEYAGINAMNAAFQNRYIKIHLPYIQGEELAQMLAEKTGITYEDGMTIATCWEKYMNSKDIEQPVVSIRMLEWWGELSHVLGLREAGVITFASLIAEDEDDLATIVQGDFFINIPDTQ